MEIIIAKGKVNKEVFSGGGLVGSYQVWIGEEEWCEEIRFRASKLDGKLGKLIFIEANSEIIKLDTGIVKISQTKSDDRTFVIGNVVIVGATVDIAEKLESLENKKVEISIKIEKNISD